MKPFSAAAAFAAVLLYASPVAAEPRATVERVDGPKTLPYISVLAGKDDSVNFLHAFALACSGQGPTLAARLLIFSEKKPGQDEDALKRSAEAIRKQGESILLSATRASPWWLAPFERIAAPVNEQLATIAERITQNTGVLTYITATPGDIMPLEACPYIIEPNPKGSVSWHTLQRMDIRSNAAQRTMPPQKPPQAKDWQVRFGNP